MAIPPAVLLLSPLFLFTRGSVDGPINFSRFLSRCKTSSATLPTAVAVAIVDSDNDDCSDDDECANESPKSVLKGPNTRKELLLLLLL